MAIDADEMVKNLIPQIEEQITKRALDSLGYAVQERIKEAVLKHVDEVVMPLVKEQLAADTAEHAALLVAAMNRVTAELAQRVEEIAIKKLASYDGNKLVGELMTKMFGRGY